MRPDQLDAYLALIVERGCYAFVACHRIGSPVGIPQWRSGWLKLLGREVMSEGGGAPWIRSNLATSGEILLIYSWL
jgi:hypothetical protein